jgi:hypothetical protein
MIWKLLNTPLVLAFLSIGLGSYVLHWISRKWQRKQIEFELRYRIYQQIVLVFFNLYSQLATLRNTKDLCNLKETAYNDKLFIEEYAKAMSIGTMCSLIFKNKDIHKEMQQMLYLFIQKRDRLDCKEMSLEDCQLVKSINIILKSALDEIRHNFN